MATKLIKKEELGETWDYGDVCVKTFSFGDRLRLGGFATSIQYNNGNPVQKDKDIDIANLNVFSLAAGILYVKLKDNLNFLIKSDTVAEEKAKIVDRFEFEPAKKLLEAVSELNTGLGVEEKKL